MSGSIWNWPTNPAHRLLMRIATICMVVAAMAIQGRWDLALVLGSIGIFITVFWTLIERDK